MKIGIILTISLFLIGFVYPEAAETGSFKPEEEPAPQEPTICGDDICQTIEEGICPEDCQEGYNSNANNISNNTRKENFRPDGESAVLITVILGSFSLLIVILILLKRQMKKSKEDDSLENWINNQLEEGYRANEIKNILVSEGYDPELVEEVLKNNKYS